MATNQEAASQHQLGIQASTVEAQDVGHQLLSLSMTLGDRTSRDVRLVDHAGTRVTRKMVSSRRRWRRAVL